VAEAPYHQARNLFIIDIGTNGESILLGQSLIQNIALPT